MTEIGEDAFCYCSSLANVTIGNSVTTIGEAAFSNCRSLTSITIPDSVTEIGERAFRECCSLKEFKGKYASNDGRCLIMNNAVIAYAEASGTTYTIPDGVKEIGEYAFSGCESLTSITIPDSVTEIGESTFDGCSCLKEFKGKYASNDGRCLIKDNSVIAYAEASGSTYTIPDSVTEIGEYAFYNCCSLTSITIPDSVTEIGEYAFYSCDSLTRINIPNSVTKIGAWSFYNCKSLTSITIPNSVTTIRTYSFCFCDNLEAVYCKATTPPTVVLFNEDSNWNAFYDNAYNRKIYVPRGSVEAYKNAEGWKQYADDIEGYDF